MKCKSMRLFVQAQLWICSSSCSCCTSLERHQLGSSQSAQASDETFTSGCEGNSENDEDGQHEDGQRCLHAK